MEGLEPGCLTLYLAAHLLDEQFRVGLDSHVPMPVLDGVAERGEQPVVFRDVVGCDAEAAVQLVDQRSRRLISMRTP